MFYLGPRGAPPVPQTGHLSSAKPSLFQCLLRLGQQIVVFRSGRRLWALHCCCQAILETPGASNHHSGRSNAVVKPYSKPLAHQITTLAAPLLWSSHIRNPWRIKSQAFANFWGSGPAKMMCFLRTGQQILQKLCV